MLPNISLTRRLSGIVRFGTGLSAGAGKSASSTRRLSGIVRFGTLCMLALSLLSAGCSNPGFRHDNLAPAPTLEMGQQVPQDGHDTEPFALTNEGRRIEDRLLSGQRPVRLPD